MILLLKYKTVCKKRQKNAITNFAVTSISREWQTSHEAGVWMGIKPNGLFKLHMNYVD